jgi:hypothetical protein
VRNTLLVLSIALLAGCASSGSPRYVLIESDSYGCGAAEGLGCGLAIAPLLERIDELDGVAKSSVSWDGRLFRIEVAPGADSERVTAAATALMEGEACCVTAARGAAAPGEPGRWYDAVQTVDLSRHEASVIAADFAAQISSQASLDPAEAARLQDILREELEVAFERAHAAGGGIPRLWEELPAARTRCEARLSTFLTPEELERVAAVVDHELQE